MPAGYKPNTDPKPKSIFVKENVQPRALTTIADVVTTFNLLKQNAQPETWLQKYERQAMQVLQGEGVKILDSFPEDLFRKATIQVLDGGRGFIVGEGSERAKIAITLLSTVVSVRRALSKGSLRGVMVNSALAGELAGLLHALPFDSLIQRMASGRQRGSETQHAKHSSERQDLAKRVHAWCQKGKLLQEACRLVADEWAKKFPGKPKRNLEALRRVYREFYPFKPNRVVS